MYLEAIRKITAAILLYSITVLPVSAQSGGIVANGTNTGITTPGFLFEPEVPFTSLKNVPTWSELEQMLDNPYVATPDPATPGNDNGFPSYRATGVIRRPGFGVTLPSFLVHPLNYNPTTGEEMRLINPEYPGGTFNVIDQLVLSGDPLTGTYTWTTTSANISPGSSRINVTEPETHIDYNNPIGADVPFCAISLETAPPEGALLCGGDPGEPNYFGFGVNNPAGYSTPAVPGVASPGDFISSTARLFDPVRGVIEARDPVTGAGGLRKPSLRVPENTGGLGSPSNPAYLINTDPNNVTASNENDYIRNRDRAIQLGKAMFWDMQVGSDGVQSCGTCHFNGTGTDTRTKNQINPNHLGGDNSFQLMQPNQRDLVAGDFPLHKLTNPEIAGDPACTTPLVANDAAAIAAQAAIIPANAPATVSSHFFNPVSNGVTVCAASNIAGDVNDVVSSMGVVFSPFTDIAAIGAFQPAVNGVAAVMPDLRTVGAPDPIPGFQGIRRVEPRNTPTMQAAGFNFDNFWDGRARHDFNGGSVFGAADPQTHVFVDDATNLTPTRQIIRFVSIASLATGPGLSEFEMSFLGRNWQKIGKKLLQGTVLPSATSVTPLANQLVDTTDSVLGIWSNQGGTECAARGRATTPLKPGLCTTYQELIQEAYYPTLWQNTSQHLNGTSAPCTNAVLGVLTPAGCDPFDAFVLTVAPGPAVAGDTSQFTQMEGNFSLFWGLAVQSWVNILVPDNTPFDQFLDANPGAFAALGEPGEPALVEDLLNCGQRTPVLGDVNDPNYCFTEVGNFKRDRNVFALRKPTGEGGAGGTYVVSGGTRTPNSNQPDPLLGLDIFFASNLSLKNPNFRTGRCGECHAIPTLTDHTMPFTSKINLMDMVAEFATPGAELIIEPLARLRVISGFLLESEINENGQDAVERRFVDQSIVPSPADGLAYPGGLRNPNGTAVGNDGVTRIPTSVPGDSRYAGADASFLDNGIYNLGVRPIAEDLGRGGNDPFGWPLSISTLMMKNLAGPDFSPGGDDPANGFAQPAAPGILISTVDPNDLSTAFDPTAQDPQINPGYEGEPANPLLPPYLGAFVNNITVGDFPPELDEAGGAIGGMVNTLTDVSMIEGFMDTLGPFNPANIFAEVLNFGGFSNRPGDNSNMMGTWPNVNRVGRMGSFKAPQLRNVEQTGPYFHNGGKLTLRQVVDFYTRGGDFPVTNAAHRDFNLVNMNVEIQSNLSEAEKVGLVDFLLELTDDRNRFARAPFDHPEVIVPIDGLAPDNTLGRTALLADPRFRSIPAVGAAGLATAEPAFLNVLGRAPGLNGQPLLRLSGAAANCTANPGRSQYCH
jgi:cytochrome c peroxidase